MPLIHERTFRVRHYECDAYGHVNHANYLRYMQEAAIDASAAAGYDETRYQAMHRLWLIRETDITYLRPLTAGQSVIVKTWVDDFRRVRSRRAYELRQAETGELVAQAHTDWVFMDLRNQRPVTVPEALVRAFFPEGLPDTGRRREPFPKAPPPPPGIFKKRQQVLWRHIDPAQHVNNAMYMAYIEDCGVQVAAAHGWPMTRMMEAGFGIVARRYRIQYRQPALLGDELEVATWISDVKRATAVRHYTITRAADQELLARAHVLWVWVKLENGRPMRIPPHFLADFTANISEDGSGH
jgi:acyl-CoA thioester hydrolase